MKWTWVDNILGVVARHASCRLNVIYSLDNFVALPVSVAFSFQPPVLLSMHFSQPVTFPAYSSIQLPSFGVHLWLSPFLPAQFPASFAVSCISCLLSPYLLIILLFFFLGIKLLQQCICVELFVIATFTFRVLFFIACIRVNFQLFISIGLNNMPSIQLRLALVVPCFLTQADDN